MASRRVHQLSRTCMAGGTVYMGTFKRETSTTNLIIIFGGKKKLGKIRVCGGGGLHQVAKREGKPERFSSCCGGD